MWRFKYRASWPKKVFRQRKKSTFPPPIFRKVCFSPSTLKPGKPPPSTFQTMHFTSLERFATVKGGFATVTVVFSFFLFRLNL
jgi:hypothetical protein